MSDENVGAASAGATPGGSAGSRSSDPGDRRPSLVPASAAPGAGTGAEPASGPAADRIHRGTRVVLVAFVVFTLLAANQLLMLTAQTDRYFAWTIHDEPTAAFLGAGYAAGFVLSVLALRAARWAQIRVALVTVTAFTLLTLIATLVHHHRFHLMAGGPAARFAAWLWLAVYLVIPLACLLVVARQQRRRGPAEAVRRPMPGWLAAVLAGQGAALFAAGAALFAGGATRHHMPQPWTGFWPLPLAPLTAQAVGAWLVAFGLAAGMAIWEHDLSRLQVPAAAYTAFGALELLVVLRYRAQLSAEDPWLWAYLALFATIVPTGGYGWWAARRRTHPTHTGAHPADRSPAGVTQPGPPD